MRWRNKLLLLEAETTYGTDPVPSETTDAILTRNLAIEPYGGQVVGRNLDRRQFGADTQINTGALVTVSFECDAVGAGAAGTAPGYGDALRACGLSRSINAGVSVTFTPRSDPNISGSGASCSMYFFVDGQRHVVKGARGNVRCRFARGQLPVFIFTFTGFYARPTTVANPTPTWGSTWTTPLPVTKANTPTFSLHGYAPPMESLEVDLGNQVVYRNVVGTEEVRIVDRAPSAQVVIEAPVFGSKNYFAAMESHEGTITLDALQLIHGVSAGAIVQIDAPKVQIAAITPAESDGLYVHQMNCILVPNAGDDEIVFTIK